MGSINTLFGFLAIIVTHTSFSSLGLKLIEKENKKH